MTRRIGDVAKAAGVGVETIRFYEREGLIEQPAKPERGWRTYGAKATRQLGLVRLAQQVGLTLSDAKRLKQAAGGSQEGFCSEAREAVTSRLAAVEAEIGKLEVKRAALRGWLEHCSRQAHGADCPLYAQVRAATTTMTERRLGARRAVLVMAAIIMSGLPALARQPDGVDDLVRRFSRAWDGANAPALGKLFAEDADLIAPDGLVITGRADIVRYYGAAFASGYAGSVGEGQVLREREIEPSLVLLDARFTITGARTGVDTGHRTMTGLVAALLRHEDDGWRIVAWREKGGGAFNPLPSRR